MSKYDDIFITDPGYKAIADKADADWQAAYEAGDEEGMKRAHKTKEEVRAMHGYSGGEDGSQYIQLEKKQKNEKPSYVSSYDEIMAKTVGQVLNRAPFTYDHESDPTYQQYADTYTRMGQKAMDDTLGKVSARTGGLASSYATTAAQQTYDGYMAQLADKVPELRQLAYQMYQDEGAEQRQNLQLLQNLEQIAYGRYQDELDQYNADRDYNYKVGRDAVVDEQWQQEFDTRNNQWQQEVDYERGLTAAKLLAQSGNYSGYKDLFDLSDADIEALNAGYISEKELQSAQLLAQAGDFSGYQKIFNLSPEKVAKLEKAFRQQNAPKVTGSGGGGGDPSMGWSDVEGWVSKYGEDAAEDYIGEHYKALGYSSKSAALSAWNNHQLESGAVDDGTFSGVEVVTRGARGNTGNGGYRWNGKVYSSIDELATAFIESDPSPYAIEKMNEFLAQYGKEIATA